MTAPVSSHVLLVFAFEVALANIGSVLSRLVGSVDFFLIIFFAFFLGRGRLFSLLGLFIGFFALLLSLRLSLARLFWFFVLGFTFFSLVLRSFGGLLFGLALSFLFGSLTILS
jgi:hypothetical protein